MATADTVTSTSGASPRSSAGEAEDSHNQTDTASSALDDASSAMHSTRAKDASSSSSSRPNQSTNGSRMDAPAPSTGHDNPSSPRDRRGDSADDTRSGVSEDEGGGDGEEDGETDDEDDVGASKPLAHLEFSMTVHHFGDKARAPATIPEVSELYGSDATGHWRLLVYPRSHRGDEQWCSAYLAAAVDTDSLGHGWWKKVDFSITAEHQEVESSVTRRGTNTFKGRGTTLAHNFEWGYNDLIKVDTLLKNNFLKPPYESLTLRVELTVLEKKDGVSYAELSKDELQEDLIWAVGVAAVPMVKECLACHADPASVYDPKKMDTPLHKAASTPGWRPGAADVVTLLLEAGAPVNAVNDLEETPLLLAADVSGCAEICSRLLAYGADPTFRTDNGWSPMNCAAKRGRDEIIRLLVSHTCPLEEPTTEYSALLHAAAQGHVHTVLLLLSCGADANVTDRHGDTALWKLVDQDLSEAALYMVQDHHASIQRCSRDRKKVTKARLMLKHAEKKQRSKKTAAVSTNSAGGDTVPHSSQFPASATNRADDDEQAAQQAREALVQSLEDEERRHQETEQKKKEKRRKKKQAAKAKKQAANPANNRCSNSNSGSSTAADATASSNDGGTVDKVAEQAPIRTTTSTPPQSPPPPPNKPASDASSVQPTEQLTTTAVVSNSTAASVRDEQEQQSSSQASKSKEGRNAKKKRLRKEQTKAEALPPASQQQQQSRAGMGKSVMPPPPPSKQPGRPSSPPADVRPDRSRPASSTTPIGKPPRQNQSMSDPVDQLGFESMMLGSQIIGHDDRTTAIKPHQQTANGNSGARILTHPSTLTTSASNVSIEEETGTWLDCEWGDLEQEILGLTTTGDM